MIFIVLASLLKSKNNISYLKSYLKSSRVYPKMFKNAVLVVSLLCVCVDTFLVFL